MAIIRTNETIKKAPFDGASASIVHGEQLTTATWTFTPGTSLPAHSHPHEQITVVVAGTLELTISGTTYTLEAGDHAVIPGGAEHEARAVTETTVIDAFHPVREDLR